MTKWVFPFLILSTSFAFDSWIINWPGDSQISLVNPASFDQNVTIRIYSVEGALLDKKAMSLAAFTKAIFTPDYATDISIALSSPAAILMDSVYWTGTSFIEQTGTRPIKATHFIPHIAEQTEYWETRANLLCTQKAQIQLRTNQQQLALPQQSPYSSYQLNMETYLQDQQPSWREIYLTDAPVCGYFSFYNESKTQIAGLTTEFIRDTYLILPHIPSDQNTWWTGIVILNPNPSQISVEFKWHPEDAAPFSTFLTLQPGEKKSALVENLSGGQLADWAEILSNEPILGFELFGTKNEQSLCGLPLTNRLAKNHVFSTVGEDDTWAGFSLLNPGKEAAQVEFRQYGAEGQLQRSDAITILPAHRVRFVSSSTFPIAQPSKTWCEVVSTRGIQAFQLVGRYDQLALATLTGLPFSEDEFHLALSEAISEHSNVPGTGFEFKDIDGDLQKDFIISTFDGIEILSHINDEVDFKSFTYEELGLSPEGPRPVPIAIEDLDQDGKMELMLLDVSMHILTLDSAQGFLPFQSAHPNLEGTSSISGFADINLDGLLDILTGRCYFKSGSTEKNPYYPNSFPYQLKTSGRASQFMDLNQDTIPDILTSLQDELHAFLSYGSTDDIGPPFYVPHAFKPVLALFQQDMNADGRKDAICLLGDSNNNSYGSLFHIADLAWENPQKISEIPIPDDLAIGFLKPIPPPQEGIARFVQNLPYCSRFLDVSLEGIDSIFYRTGTGVITDINGDDIPDQIAPWGVCLTEPTGQFRNPAFLYHDDTNDSFTAGLFKVPGNPFWVAYKVLIPESSCQIQIFRESGFNRNPEQVQKINLPIGYPGFLAYEDMNEDGYRDILVAGSGLIYFANHNGVIDVNPTFIHGPNVFTIGMARPCDLDGNSEPDLLGCQVNGVPPIKIILDYKSNSPQVVTLDADVKPRELSITDLNDDGLGDLIIQPQDHDGAILWNNGGGQFTKSNLPDEFMCVTTLDFQGDGMQDIVAYVNIKESGNSYFRVFQNTGDTEFQYGLSQPIFPSEPYWKTLAIDLNEDGREDIIGLKNNSYMDIWINRNDSLTRMPFEFSHAVPFRGRPEVSLWDRNTDLVPDLEFTYPGVECWRLNKVSYFPQTKTPEPVNKK